MDDPAYTAAVAYGFSRLFEEYRDDGSGRVVCYSHRVDYDATGSEVGRTEPVALSSLVYAERG